MQISAVPGQPDGDVLEVVLPGAVDDELVGGHRAPVYRVEQYVRAEATFTRLDVDLGKPCRCVDLPRGRQPEAMGETARKSFVATIVAVGRGRLGARDLAPAGPGRAAPARDDHRRRRCGPGSSWLNRRRVPRGVGVAIHYVGFLLAIGLLLWLIVPRALDQIETALGTLPTSTSDVADAARKSHGIKHEILVGIQHQLERLPRGAGLHPAVTYGRTALEVLVGIFFTFAVAAYWVFEKERAQTLILGLVSRKHRRVVRDTWDLIDAKLGAFVRGQLLMMTFVSTVLSFAFWLDGLPYWLLIGVFAGIVEIVPVIGPLAAGVLAIGAGLTASWQTAVGAAIAVLRSAARPGLRDQPAGARATPSASRRWSCSSR